MKLARLISGMSLTAFVLCSIACSGLTHDSPATARTNGANSKEPQVLTQRSDRTMIQLGNGLIIIAQNIPSAPVVSVQCWVKTGSIYEQEFNGSGLSHFLEHLIAGGSTKFRSENENNEIIGRIGASTNAATSLDAVHYYIDTSSEHADRAVELMTQWIFHSTIPETEYQREREVIQREFDMGRGEPGRIHWKLTQQVRYRQHPARHPTIGYLDEYLKVSREQIYDFYKRMYVPNNAVFVVAGAIDPQQIAAQVSSLCKDLPAGPLPTIKFPIEEPLNAPRTIEGRADIDRPRLRLAWPGVRLGTPDDYALDLLGQILGQGELSRLVRQVRDDKQLASSIDAYNYSESWGEAFFGVDAMVAKDKLQEAEQAILAEIEKLKTGGVKPEELERAKRKTVAAVVYESQTAQATASRLASDFIHTGDPDYLQRYAKNIQAIKPEQIVAVAKKYLVPEKQIRVTLVPDKASPTQLTRPDEEKAGILGEESVSLDNSQLIAKLKSLSTDNSAAVGGQLHPMRLHRLSNGLRLIVQRNTHLPIVSMQWYQLGGLLADAAGHEGLANAASQMMVKGAAGRSADAIAARLEELGAQLSSDCGNSTQYVQTQSLAGDWQDVLELMSQVILKPDFPDAEWQKMKPRLLAAIDSQNDVWHAQLRNAFRSAYFGKHPWSQPVLGRHEVVKDLGVSDLKKFHTEHLTAAQSVLAVFGDIDEEKIIQEAERLFAAMPAQAAQRVMIPGPARFTPQVHVVESSKPMAAVQIGFGPGLERQNPDYAAMLVMNSVLDSFPVGWLDRALRGEGPGLVYAVGSGISTGAAPGYWAVLFNTTPPRLTEAWQRTLDVTDRIRDKAPDAATLERARTKVLTAEAIGQQTNGQRAASAALDELYGLGFDASDRFIGEIRAIKASDVHRVARQYLQKPLAVILTNEKIDPASLKPLMPEQAAPAAPQPIE